MLKNPRVFVNYVVSVVKICFLRHIQYKVFLHVLTLPKLVTVLWREIAPRPEKIFYKVESDWMPLSCPMMYYGENAEGLSCNTR